MTLPARSDRLIDRNRSLLLIIDLQAKLLPLIRSNATITWNIERLLAGANALSVPYLVTEQYPEKLGATVSLGESQIVATSKRMFSCRECSEPLADFRIRGLNQAVICGIETHVCVLQTALDLLADAWQVFIAVDATGSRMQLDYETALRRMSAESVVLTTTESVLFEWCETSTAPEFRTISSLVRQLNPSGSHLPDATA
jgi:isochorismate hydrolase